MAITAGRDGIERTDDQPAAAVIGASMAGIFAAAALARSGFTVTVLERDRLPSAPRGRRGVPQDAQAHILLYRGMTAIEGLLPGFRRGLLARGAVPFDSGQMPWLGEHGWLEVSPSSIEVVSATRPLMEAVARSRLGELPGVAICDERTVTGLQRTAAGWLVHGSGGSVDAQVVIDASGRSSRLPHWMPGLGRPPEQQVDARVGYSGRLYAERDPLPVRTGIMIMSSPGTGTAGLALPVEDRGWLVAAAGFGDRRPPRDEAGYNRFLAGLRDPAIADLTAALRPVSAVSVHRQTGNLRRRWDRVGDWPDGLLVIGDALCALDPIYGQGITVAAQQAQALAAALRRGRRVDRSLQRTMVAATEVPWSIATTADLRAPTCEGRPTVGQRLSMAWSDRLAVLAAAGNRRANRAIASVYHLTASPAALLHPALLLAAARPLPANRLPRPTVLEDLRRVRRERPPVGPAGA